MAARDLRSEILKAALKVFLKKGYAETTVAEICQRARTSNGAMFHHFASKEAVAEALYVEGIASYQQGLKPVLGKPPENARAAIFAAVRHQIVWTERNRDLARFMYDRGRPEWRVASGESVGRLNRDFVALFRAWLAPLIKSGQIRAVPGPVLAAFVFGPVHFIAHRWLTGLIELPPSAFTDDLAETSWASLAPGGAEAADRDVKRENHFGTSPSGKPIVEDFPAKENVIRVSDDKTRFLLRLAPNADAFPRGSESVLAELARGSEAALRSVRGSDCAADCIQMSLSLFRPPAAFPVQLLLRAIVSHQEDQRATVDADIIDEDENVQARSSGIYILAKADAVTPGGVTDPPQGTIEPVVNTIKNKPKARAATARDGAESVLKRDH